MTKLDDTFPLAQFYVEEFTMAYRLNRNRNGVGVTIYLREDIPIKILEKQKLPQDVEGIFVELNFRKKQMVASLNPSSPFKMTSTILKHLIKL